MSMTTYSLPSRQREHKKNVPYGTYIINGGEHEIRTHGSFHYATFPRWCLKPLGQLSKVTSIILLIFKEMSTINCIISYFFVYSKLLFARFIISIALIRKKIPSGSNLIHKGVSSIVSLSDA